MTDTAAAEETREKVRDSYAAIVTGGGNAGCCSPAQDDSSCGGPETPTVEEFSRAFGYSDDEMAAVPEGANLGVGCGNPSAIAAMKAGETVVDLGSGAGFDCFLSARQVGKSGRVIGVDMTPEMLKKARENARKMDFTNVEFRLGEIEHLPIADNTADVIISNCVINLSPDKQAVFRDAFRVLATGGRLAISDVVATEALPDDLMGDDELLCGCVTGAATVDEISQWLTDAGYTEINIQVKEESREVIKDWAPGRGIEKYVASATIEAVKPGE